MSQLMQGQLSHSPLMQTFNQMMSGKTKEQQIQTLINIAKSRGFDVDAKLFSEEDLRKLKLK